MYLLEINLATTIQIAGTFMFFIVIAWMLAEFNGMKTEIRNRLGINNETLKLKLQAYERLTLYAERASLKNLVPRLHSQTATARDLQLALIKELNTEYEYNVSQQIYISPEMWKAITKLRDQNIYIINQVASALPVDATSLDLSRALLEFASNANSEVSKIVLDALQFEAKKIM